VEKEVIKLEVGAATNRVVELPIEQFREVHYVLCSFNLKKAGAGK